MHAEMRQFIASAALLDHTFDGYTGSGHMRFLHPTAGMYIASSTPSDRNTIRKQLSDMERRSGKRLPRAKSGHFRRKVTDREAERLREQRAAQERREERRTPARVSGQRNRSAVAAAITAAEQHRREIEALMRHGYGR